MLTLVVARYNEDLSWLSLVRGANIVVVNKSAIGNTGREASSYLWFIVKHWPYLDGDYVFCQGDPLAHCPDFLEAIHTERRTFGPIVECDLTGAPHHPGLRIGDFADAANLTQPLVRLAVADAPLQFVSGAQFKRSAAEIKFRPRFFYEKLWQLCDHFPDGPWIMERLWGYAIPEHRTSKQST